MARSVLINEAGTPFGTLANPVRVRAIPTDAADAVLGTDANPLRTRLGLANPTPASGRVVAAAAAALIADTGALAAGAYRVEFTVGLSGALAAGKGIDLEHRDAANAATLRNLAHCPGGQMVDGVIERIVLAANERIRAVQGAVAGEAASVSHASIRATLVQ